MLLRVIELNFLFGVCRDNYVVSNYTILTYLKIYINII